MLRIKILILFLPLLLLADAQNGRFSGRLPIRRPMPPLRSWVQPTLSPTPDTPMPTEQIITKVTQLQIPQIPSKADQRITTKPKLTIVYPENSHITPDVLPPINRPARPVSPIWPRTAIRPNKEPTEASATEVTPSTNMEEDVKTEKDHIANNPLDTSVNPVGSKVNWPSVQPNQPTTEQNSPPVTSVTTVDANENWPPVVVPSQPWYPSPTTEPNNPPVTSVTTVSPNVNWPPVVVPSQPWYPSPTTEPNNPPVTSVTTVSPNVNWPPVVVPSQPWYPPPTTEPNNPPVTSVTTVSPNVNSPAVVVPSQPWYPPPTTEPNSPPVTSATTIEPIVNWPPAVVPSKPWYPKPTAVPAKPQVNSWNQLQDYDCQEPNGYYSVARQCDVYIECKKNIAIQYSCFDGLHFNPKAQWPGFPCSYPADVKCQSKDNVQDPHPTSECPRQYGFFPVTSGDCGKYTMCQEGIAEVMSCPTGLAFNFNISSCDWPINVPGCSPDVFRGFTCPAPPIRDDTEPFNFIYKYRYEKSCKKYIACQEGHPRLLSCDSGLSFDEESESCVNADFILDCVD